VPWCEVATVLSALFLQNTGRVLDDDQLRYLARTAFSMLLLLLLTDFVDGSDEVDNDSTHYSAADCLCTDQKIFLAYRRCLPRYLFINITLGHYRQTNATCCNLPTVLYTKMDAQCDKCVMVLSQTLLMVNMRWN